ncbi:MAG: DUF3048 C-terminal domain-containing protein [Actinobacteria bacterium]|nr:DUF3048 C-terminal domain-containing protein [Actinomycetota bacterium]
MLVTALTAVAACTPAESEPAASATSSRGVEAVPSGSASSGGYPGDATSGSPSPATRVTGPPLAITVAVDGPPATLAGLNEAATVVEYPLTSRRPALVVVSRGGTAAVGPLRAATTGDATVANLFDAPLVATIASRAVTEALAAGDRALVEEGAPAGAVLRDPARRAPFNVYALPARARRLVDGESTALDGPWTRGGTPPSSGRSAAEVIVDLTTWVSVVWTWDDTAQRWLRTADGQPTVTADGSRVSTATVVVLEVPDPRGGLPTAAGRGPAAVLRDGRRHPARWSHDGGAQLPLLQARDGAAFPVEGRVWVMVCAAPCAQQIAPSAPRPGGAAR